jgi:hypothetical protein
MISPGSKIPLPSSPAPKAPRIHPTPPYTKSPRAEKKNRANHVAESQRNFAHDQLHHTISPGSKIPLPSSPAPKARLIPARGTAPGSNSNKKTGLKARLIDASSLIKMINHQCSSVSSVVKISPSESLHEVSRAFSPALHHGVSNPHPLAKAGMRPGLCP